MKTPKEKPYPANQYVFDPRQDKCWEYFIDRQSNTHGNAYGSALRAGYAQSTSKHITDEEWWKENIRRMTLGSKAEKVLEKTLVMETNLPVIGQYGAILIPTGEFDKKGREIKKLLYGENDRLLKIQQDSAKFVAERLIKKHYSNRSELTGADGKDLPTPIYGATAN